MKEIRKCPVCNKLLKWNYMKGRWECPKIKREHDKKLGCGYIHIPLTKFK